jgi:hypothetical protein
MEFKAAKEAASKEQADQKPTEKGKASGEEESDDSELGFANDPYGYGGGEYGGYGGYGDEYGDPYGYGGGGYSTKKKDKKKKEKPKSS